MGLESVWERGTPSQFFFHIYTKYFLFHYLLSFQWALRKALTVLIPPCQVFMHIDQMPPGLSLWPGPQSQPPQPHLLKIPSMEPFQHIQVRFVLGAPGVAPPVLSRGAGGRLTSLILLLLSQPSILLAFWEKKSPGGCQLSMLLCNFIEAGSSYLSASKGK